MTSTRVISTPEPTKRERSMSYPVPARQHLAAYGPAEQLARAWYEAYERRAFNEYGDLPRPWDALTPVDQELHIIVAQELLDREYIDYLPECHHEISKLVWFEARQCQLCGRLPRLERRLREEGGEMKEMREMKAANNPTGGNPPPGDSTPAYQSPELMSLPCPSCGEYVEPNQNFCAQCGAPRPSTRMRWSMETK